MKVTKVEHMGNITIATVQSGPEWEFGAFKKEVIRLSKKAKVGHQCPNSDTLYALWEQLLTPQQVVEQHCTAEAQRKRHGL